MDNKYIESLKRLSKNPFYMMTAKQAADLEKWKDKKEEDFLDLNKISSAANDGIGVEEVVEEKIEEEVETIVEEKPKKKKAKKSTEKTEK